SRIFLIYFIVFQAEDGIRDRNVTGIQTCALPIWFLAYIVLSYSFGYFISPLIWRAGHRYNALTAADIFKSHFSSRKLELVVAVVLLMFLVPWAQLQFEGLIVTLNALGYDIPPYIAVIIAV